MSVQFFYLKEYRNGGNHRVGAIAIETDDLGHKVAASLCSDEDTFSSKYAKNSTLGRWKSSQVYVEKGASIETVLNTCFNTCPSKSLRGYNFHSVLGNSHNQRTLDHAIDTLEGNYEKESV